MKIGPLVLYNTTMITGTASTIIVIKSVDVLIAVIRVVVQCAVVFQ